MNTMKILVIDRDRTTIDTFETLSKDHENIQLTVETTKTAAMERLKSEDYDAVFIDPAPQNDELRPFIIGIRRVCKTFIPVIVMSHKFSENDARSHGAGDFLPKPIDNDIFVKKLENIKNFTTFNSQLHDDTNHYPSAEGVISKSAFNQIFISCLDRSDRYGDKTFLMFTRIENIDDIQNTHGVEAASQLCDKLKYYTMKTRRLSDIAGRTAHNEICLMLMRPRNDDEPLLAAQRLAETIKGCHNLITLDNIDIAPQISVSLMAIPSGEIQFHQNFE